MTRLGTESAIVPVVDFSPIKCQESRSIAESRLKTMLFTIADLRLRDISLNR
jgi:hypothetical protein